MRSIFTCLLFTCFTYFTGIAQEFLITTQKSKIHSGPATTFNPIAELHQGTLVYVIDDYGEWTAIQYRNLNGFVATKFLSTYTPQAYDTNDQITSIKKQTQIDIENVQQEANQKIADAKRIYEETIKNIEQDQIALQKKVSDELQKIQDQIEYNEDIAAQERKETLLALEEAKKRVLNEQKGIGITTITSSTSSTGISNKKDPYKNWEKKHYDTGTTPESFNIKGIYDYTIDNYLKIDVGSTTDVVVKLYKKNSTEVNDQCIRIVYLNNNTSKYIKNIPEGEYYLKIAYGKEWKETIKDGKRYGIFTKDALYEKGDETLSFYAIKTEKGINIPSYTLLLDIHPNSNAEYESTEQNHISAKEFNDL